MNRREFIGVFGGAARVATRGGRASGGDAADWVLATIEPYSIRLRGLPRPLKYW